MGVVKNAKNSKKNHDYKFRPDFDGLYQRKGRKRGQERVELYKTHPAEGTEDIRGRSKRGKEGNH